MTGANSTEFEPKTPYPVISLLPEQRPDIPKGGTMRLGSYECRLAEGSRAREAYGTDVVRERHRHRYEFDNAFREDLEGCGLKATGICPENDLVEIVELEDHPWFMAVQFHPELKSRPLSPHPLFKSFIHAACQYREAGSYVST
jgi:CTP synthase